MSLAYRLTEDRSAHPRHCRLPRHHLRAVDEPMEFGVDADGESPIAHRSWGSPGKCVQAITLSFEISPATSVAFQTA